MQKPVIKKTKSALSLVVVLTLIIAVVFAAGLTGVFDRRSNSSDDRSRTNEGYGSGCLSIGDNRCAIQLEISDNDELRRLGLSGRSSLANDRGMLFVFDSEGTHCFWMKDMNFSIDMVWLDKSMKIIKIEHDVGPDTYPNQYCPESPATYVLELQAGQGKAIGLNVGSVLDVTY